MLWLAKWGRYGSQQHCDCETCYSVISDSRGVVAEVSHMLSSSDVGARHTSSSIIVEWH